MIHKYLTLTLVAAIAIPSLAAQERVVDPRAGIELSRPSGWHDATAAQVQANRERVRLPDRELERALQTRSALPVLVFMKYPEPHAGLNPSIQVTLRAALRGAPTDLLASSLDVMRRGFPDFRVVSPVQPATVGGLPGAAVIVTYTLASTGGNRFPVRSRLWLVPRGNLMFLIGMSGATDGEDVAEAEFRTALESIRIDP
jgi:hypothetical protein